MCGITGFLNWSQDVSKEKEILKKMTDSISHRGPDDEGFWVSKHVAFGHRRLIVIDPEGGHQPMIYNDYVLVFNGEIYNYKELREELMLKGHSFKTNSDTEVLLHCYIEWKEECPKYMNGIFAFAVWDQQKQQLYLARDHLGVKPLFYAQRGTSFLFGSELKALLANPLVEPVIDLEGLAELFCLNPFHTPGNGVYKDVHQLLPGHYIIVGKENETCRQPMIKIQRFFYLKSKPHTDSIDETVETIRRLLIDSVKRQLQSDVPIAAMLSGGVDSSGLVAIAAKEFEKQGRQLDTFSLTFENDEKQFKPDFIRPTRDEPYARLVSDHSKTKHHTVSLKDQEIIDNLMVPLKARDYPGIGEIESSISLLFGEMKKTSTVAISGESSDELFSGYGSWFFNEKLLNTEKFPWLINFIPPSKVLSEEFQLKIKPDQFIHQKYLEAVKEIDFLEGENDIQRKQRQMSHMFISRYLGFMFERKDRNSMTHGYEVRVPYSDYRIAQYLWNVPLEMKSIDGIEKGLLRRALKGLLPDEVLNRKKSGYPANRSLQYLEKVNQMILDILKDPSSPLLRFIDIDKVHQLIKDSALDFDQNGGVRIAEFLIQFNQWIKDYKVQFRF
eukprot:gene5304-6605_t